MILTNQYSGPRRSKRVEKVIQQSKPSLSALSPDLGESDSLDPDISILDPEELNIQIDEIDPDLEEFLSELD